MTLNSKFDPNDIAKGLLAAGKSYDFGDGLEEPVQVIQRLSQAYWIKTGFHEGMFDLEGRFLRGTYDLLGSNQKMSS